MWHVYRAINKTKRQVYHGASPKPEARKDGSHCKGGTKALKDWSCETNTIRWSIISSHQTQKNASEEAHRHEKEYRHREGYKNIHTKGV